MLRPRAVAAPLLALALAAAGCPSSDGSCETSAICGEGELCFEGSCVEALPVAASCTPPTNPTPTNGGVTGPASVVACSSPAPVATNLPAEWVAPLSLDGVPVSAPVTADVGQVVSFAVPPGTSSVTIHSQGIAAVPWFDAGYDCDPYTLGYQVCPNSVVPTNLQAPNGDLIYDDLLPPPQDASRLPAHYGGYTPWTGSFTFPATWRLADLTLSGGEVPPGRWSFTVNDWNAECASMAGCIPSFPSGTYDVTVVTRPGPFVSTGTLDVAIYFATNGAQTAAKAANPSDPDHPAFRRFIAGMGRVLGAGGICLGDVTFYDLSAEARDAFSTVNICDAPPCGELSQLFSYASPAVDGVHLFLVDTLDATGCYGGSGSIVGIDGSIPGPSGMPGARTSGAAMSLSGISMIGCVDGVFDIDACHADQSAYIASHEIGHWLGLYHTTEASGAAFDPMTDTATCSCDACGWGCGYEIGASDCLSDSCGGGENLMFWQLDPFYSQGTVSTQQAFVMRVNPAVK